MPKIAAVGDVQRVLRSCVHRVELEIGGAFVHEVVARAGRDELALGAQVPLLDPAPVAGKFRSFNWNVIEIDGHDLEQCIDALQQAADFGFLLGRDIANQDKLPDWRAGDSMTPCGRRRRGNGCWRCAPSPTCWQ